MAYVVDFTARYTLPGMFFSAVEAKGDHPFLWHKEDGAWKSLSYAEAGAQVRAVANALHGMGIRKGDRVALVSENRPEFAIAHFGIMAAGAVTVPTYTTNTVEDHKHIFSDSGARAVIVSTQALADRVMPAAAACEEIEGVIGINAKFSAPAGMRAVDTASWQEMLDAGSAMTDEVVNSTLANTHDDELAVLIYTSGTGGKPKGVMLAHKAIMINCRGAYEVLEQAYGLGDEVFLSFLPLSHSYEHMAGLCFPISMGAEIYYAESAEKLINNMAEVRPTIMTAVPRLFEAMRARILKQLSTASGLRRKLFWKAVDVGTKRIETPEKMTVFDRFWDRRLEKLVRAKVRDRFGGRLKALVSGGAALTPEIGLFFQALGLELLQGYGQTESAPLISVNRPHMLKMDTVGPACVGVEIRIAEDGEILCRGDNVMMGYWGKPEASAEAVVDGWLHTGDIGYLDPMGRLKITDRKKDILVLSGGDNISPARVEGQLTMQAEIGQAMVIGDKRPHLTALIVPDPEWLHAWAKKHGKPHDLKQLTEDEDLRKAIKGAIDKANKSMANLEKVRKFALVPEGFTTENAQMTPSLKIRRHIITEVYKDKIAGLYSS